VQCFLSSYEVDDTDSYREVTEIYVEPGEIQTSTRPGRIDGTTEVTIVSTGTAVAPSGQPIFSSQTEKEGYSTFTRTAIQETITGTKQTYKDVVAVDVPGEVKCTTESGTTGAGGTVAIVQVTPRRSKRVSATVTIEVTTTSPGAITPAYNLGDISCSVTTKRESFNISEGSLETNQSYSLSANTQTYPGCFLTELTSEGEVEYSSTVRSEGPQPDAKSKVTTSCVGFGSTSSSGWTETGILKRKSRPLLTDLNGTTYYEVITWSV